MDANILPIDLKTNARDVPCLQNWLKDSSFIEIQEVAISATCMITENIDLSISATNGTICTVDNIVFSTDGTMHKIVVKITSTKNKITI